MVQAQNRGHGQAAAVAMSCPIDAGKPLAYDRGVRVEWDEAKNAANQRKHGVSFEEAAELFATGDDYIEIFDEFHSETEDRFIAIGPVTRGLVLVVWTERDEDIVRIVSARWATKPERQRYRDYKDWTR